MQLLIAKSTPLFAFLSIIQNYFFYNQTLKRFVEDSDKIDLVRNMIAIFSI